MKIGILGSGQLAQMLILSNVGKKHQFLVYSDTQGEPVKNLVSQQIASYHNWNALSHFADQVDLVTFETENIPVNTLIHLQNQVPVYPQPANLWYFQDRLHEKRFFADLGIPVPPFIALETREDLQLAKTILGYPFMVKSRRGGYDGKSQWRICNQTELEALIDSNHWQNSIAETWIPFEREVSIIGVRSQSGKILSYMMSENIHQNGILRYSTVSTKPDPLQNLAEHYFTQAVNRLNYVGVLAIEFFVYETHLFVNEAAPRVHNSGHWTIEGARTSQFDNHLLAIMGKEPTSTQLVGDSFMVNFIGNLDGKIKLDSMGFCYHDYHKSARENRKIGHATLVNTNDAAAYRSDIASAKKLFNDE